MKNQSKKKNCIGCGKEFEVKSNNHIYCSQSCNQKKYYERKKDQRKEYNRKYKKNNKKKIKEYREKNKEKDKEYFKKYREDNKEHLKKNSKKYRKDNKEKLRESDSKRKKKYRRENYEKVRKKEKERYERDKEKIKERGRLHYRKDKEKAKKNVRIYQKNNKEKVRETKKRHHIKKMETDIIYNLNFNISRCMSSSLRHRGLSKNGNHWEKLVINTKEEIMKHLEKNFLPGMTWKNYGRGGWHVDHIIPREFFKFISTDDVEFKYCWSIENLQPLWEKDNNKKSDKITLWGKEINARDIDRDYFDKLAA